MLVKILSFFASILSNARYKAVLVPCLAVVLSLSAIAIDVLIIYAITRHSSEELRRPG